MHSFAWLNVSSNARDLVVKMLEKNDELRPNIEQII